MENPEANLIVLFDKNKGQYAAFKKEDGENYYELQFHINSLDDADLIEVERLSVSIQRFEGNKRIFENDDLDACAWFFDKNVQITGGFDGEIPENWQSEFTEIEKQAVVRTFLSGTIWGENKVKLKTKFAFGKQKSNKIIKIRAIFDGVEKILSHNLPTNFNNFLHNFKKITRPSESNQGEDGISASKVWEQLGELYDEMKITSDDYEVNGVPLHHKSMVIRDAFSENLSDNTKKLKA